MSYNILSGNVNFEGQGNGSIEDIVDKHSDQTINGQKTFSNLSSSSDVSITGDANIVGNVSASINISASAFYADGVFIDPTGGGISFDGSTANGVLTYKDADEATVESNLTFDGSVLDFKNTSISGSGNISGSAFYGAWAGSVIDANKIELMDDGGLSADANGLKLSIDNATAQNTPNGSVTLFIDDSGDIKKSTLTQLLTNQSVTNASALANTNQVLLGGGVGAIASNSNLNYVGNILSVTGALSASTTLHVGSHISSSGDVVVAGNVSASALQIEQYITHAGDADSYFGFGGNDLIAFVAGGVQMLTNYGNLSPRRVQVIGSDFRINSSGLDFQINESNGFVGIGDITPSVPLEISSSNDPQFKIVYNGSNAATFKVAANGNLTIGTNGASTIDSSLTINGNTILGDNSADQVTFTGTAVATTNGLNFDNGTLVLDQTNDRIGIGGTGPIETLSVSGSFQVSGSHVRARLKDSIFQVSSSVTIQSGGQTLFEVMSPTNPKLFSVVEGGMIASNINPAAFDANLYISGAVVLGAPTAVVPDANLHSGSVTFYLDEGNHKLKFKVRYSDGTVKNGDVNLT
tara:strand:+ start:107 stop:1846 length:1740 start_codon:yes stop_codon:yes gene_type:complete